jgi:hypothetical protein
MASRIFTAAWIPGSRKCAPRNDWDYGAAQYPGFVLNSFFGIAP